MWLSSSLLFYKCMLSFSAEECKADKAGNFIVPLAVGVALIVLVLVLVAYFVGRQRSRVANYEQFS